MQIGTNNRLAHMQCEYVELQERTKMLQNQLSPLAVQIQQMGTYIRTNQGDRNAAMQYRQLVKRYNTVNNTVKRNVIRLNKLQMNINREIAKQQMQMQRATYSQMNRGRRRMYY